MNVNSADDIEWYVFVYLILFGREGSPEMSTLQVCRNGPKSQKKMLLIGCLLNFSYLS